MLKPKTSVLFLAFVMAFAPVVEAQQAKDPVPGPIPVQIMSAKKAFISNLGAEVTSGTYTVGPNRAYDLFYAGMKAWSRYDLVARPGDADLILEISFVQVVVPPPNTSTADPQFKLVIRDVSTHFVLWTLIEHIDPALLQGNRDKNFDQGVRALVTSFQKLLKQPIQP